MLAPVTEARDRNADSAGGLSQAMPIWRANALADLRSHSWIKTRRKLEPGHLDGLPQSLLEPLASGIDLTIRQRLLVHNLCA